jgi:acetyl-CoA carboxylase biotin carboxylase subunit
MQIALDELLIDGIRSNTPLHRDLVRDSEFQKGGVNIHYLEQRLES